MPVTVDVVHFRPPIAGARERPQPGPAATVRGA